MPPMSDEEQKRLEWFRRLRPPAFSGFKSEDALDFLNRCQRILHTAGILETTFQLLQASFRWWEAYELSRPADATPLMWHEFLVFFLEKFVPQTHKEELCRQFEQLRQERERIRRFIDSLNYGLRFVMTQEIASGARFDEVVDIARWLEQIRNQEREERKATWLASHQSQNHKRPRGSGGFSGVSFGGQSHHNKGRPYRPDQMARPIHRGVLASHGSYSAHPGQSSLIALPAQISSRAPLVHGSSVPGPSSSYSGSRGPIRSLPPLTDRSCYECGEFGHVRRYCPRLLGGPVHQRGTSGNDFRTSYFTSRSTSLGGAQEARGRPRGGGRSSGGQARCYAFPARLEAFASDEVITGIV
ncbi:uncharacterized protein [Nicotiana tomentosiformis]|uniref:uncharacterized protein n=1 Tax=Nicotiana tomentosiformis TaxID=4098 RepID=UPI00388CE157